MSQIHISIASETIAHLPIGDFAVTNSMFGSTVVIAILILLGVFIRFSLKTGGMPSKPQLVVESIYQILEGLTKSSIGAKNARKYLGIVIILFLYIVLGSWIGLLPGITNIGIEDHGKLIPLLRAPTTDLNATTALAIVAFLSIQYSGFSELGLFGYLGKFFNFRSVGGLVLGMLELLFEFVRLISFSFRLFGNIFAGEVLLVVIGYLSTLRIPALASTPFSEIVLPFPSLIILMEFFVALIQAYVFINLMSVFIALAAEPAHSDDHHEKFEDLDSDLDLTDSTVQA